MPASKPDRPALTETLLLDDQTDTDQLALRLVDLLRAGDVVYLQGNLGVGKTFFCQSLIRHLGYKGKVLSPTYGLIQSYDVQLPPQIKSTVGQADQSQLHHFDLYRLADPEELEFIGIRDYFNCSDICLIEWPDKGKGILPPATIELTLDYSSDKNTGRIANLTIHPVRVFHDL